MMSTFCFGLVLIHWGILEVLFLTLIILKKLFSRMPVFLITM
jgi:hypothetical protein